MTNTTDDFRNKTITGIGWNVIAQVGRQGMTFIIGVILARLLSPEVYGLIGMVLLFSGFANVFLDFGFGSALVQKQNADQEHYSSVFWLNLATGAVLTIGFSLAAPLIAQFYHEPMLASLTVFISFSFIIGSLGLVQTALLQKRIMFRQLAIIDITAIILSGGLGIALAWSGYGVWSLVWQSLVQALIRVLLLWTINKWRPVMRFRWGAVKDLLKFSANLLGFSSINYWFRNADNLMIGKFLGSAALGIYAKTYSIMLVPIVLISQTISQVMFPAFSSIQEDKKRIANTYLRITGGIALITFPLMTLLWLVSEHFVWVIFGEQWVGMIPILKVFCFVGLIQSIGTLNGNLYLSQGRSDLQFKVGTIISILGVGAIVLGLKWGVEGVATAYSAFVAIIIYPSIRIAVSLVGLKFSHVVRHLSKIMICTVVMVILVWVTGFIMPENLPHWIYLVTQTATGILVYGAMVLSLRLPAYLDLKQVLYERLGRSNQTL